MNHKQNARLLKKTREYIRAVFKKKKKARALLFHNRAHIETVVKISDKMAIKYSLNADDHLVLLLSAWFHDYGYLAKTTNHKKNSAEKAETFLRKRRAPNDIIRRVKAIIVSTAFKQPDELIKQILADADRFYLSKKKFIKKNNLLRKEREWLEGKKISKETWYKRTIDFIQSHSFHTEYAREHLANGVRNNLAKLIDKLPQPDQQLAKVKPFI